MLSLEPATLFISFLWNLFFADLCRMRIRSNEKRMHSLMMMVFAWSLGVIGWRTCLLVDLCFLRWIHAFLLVELSTVVQSWMLQVFLLFHNSMSCVCPSSASSFICRHVYECDIYLTNSSIRQHIHSILQFRPFLCRPWISSFVCLLVASSFIVGKSYCTIGIMEATLLSYSLVASLYNHYKNLYRQQ